MKVGQKYSFIDKNGNERETIWMESILDMRRYFTHNVFCPFSGFSLVKENELNKIWDRLDVAIHKQINKASYLDNGDQIIFFDHSRKGLEHLNNYLNSKAPEQVLWEIEDEQNSFLPPQFQFVTLNDGTVLQDTSYGEDDC